MHKQRIWIAAICGVGLIAALMPWVTVMGMIGMSGMDLGQGWVVLALFGVAAAVAVTGSRGYPLDDARRGVVGVIGVGAVGFAIWKIIEIRNGEIEIDSMMGRGPGDAGTAGSQSADGMGELGREMGKGMLKMFGELFELSFGLYLVIAAGLALGIIAAVKKRA
ncbi:MAG: hypothetical protein H0T89_16435 [Deltaproteobacteria bacterium]|nr:hypothetical protein [Deltaproteobacteria bacterium]MDQ3297608.1 hypothetical protein [Myxococcota bacterium]